MFWADRILLQVNREVHVDDMFTPSGFAHVGSLRGPILHDVVFKIFREKFKDTLYTYIFNDFDPIDGLPEELKPKFSKFMGFPLRMVPSPDGKKGSFGEYFAEDFKKVLRSLGVEAEFLSSWDMYREGRFNDAIRQALDNVGKIQDIYMRVSGSRKKDAGWYPLQVICPGCGRLGTTRVTGWDGKLVKFTCEEAMVSWAKGCSLKGEISPFDGNGKLPWKVDWPAHWKVLGVSFEGAGKDHASRGGSYDIAFELCREVFGLEKPFYFPYEFFLLGGRKMGSSKGIGLKARELTNIIPPQIARFLIVRVIPKKAIEFDPYQADTIPDLFDEFDRLANAYWEKNDKDLVRIFEMSKIGSLYDNKLYLPRFRDTANCIEHQITDIKGHFEKLKGEKLSVEEVGILSDRIKYAKIWREHFAPEEKKLTIAKEIPKEAKELTQKQKEYLKKVLKLALKEKDPDKLQEKLFTLAKESGLGGRDAFGAIYKIFLGKTFGPKAGQFIMSLDKAMLKERIEEACFQ